MPPTENAQLEPETVVLPRLGRASQDGPVDDGDGAIGSVDDARRGPAAALAAEHRLSLAPVIEESQERRGQFRAMLDEPDEFDDEGAWSPRRLAVVLVAVALLAVTVGITLVGFGGTGQRTAEQASDAVAAAAAARADAGRNQVSAVTPGPAVTAAPVVAPTGSPSAGTSPSVRASSPTVTTGPSASTAVPSSSPTVPGPAPSAGRTATKPPVVSPSPTPTATRPKVAGPSCTVSRSTRRQFVGYSATATLTNTGGRSLAGWTSTFSLPSGYIVQTLSGGAWNQSGTTVNVMNGSTLAKGASATITFTAWAGFGPPDAGSGYTLSGTACR